MTNGAGEAGLMIRIRTVRAKAVSTARRFARVDALGGGDVGGCAALGCCGSQTRAPYTPGALVAAAVI